MLRPEQLDLVEATAPILALRGEEIIRHFYPRMFAARPDVAELFNASHQREGRQQRALTDAVLAFAAHVRELDRLAPALERIGHKHASLGIRPEHYPIVGEHLLASIAEVLGDAASDEILAAWEAAYGLLAGVLIEREADLYRAHESRFGWSSFRPLEVRDKRRESDVITSFVLVDPQGRSLGRALPGQYLTVRVPEPGGATTMRNYSLSSWGDASSFRISVKREEPPQAGAPGGHVSNYLHDEVGVGDRLEVAPPSGDFFLDPETAGESDGPLVLLSGGVGVTPLLAMLACAAETHLERDIVFVHCARTAAQHAFAREVRELARRHGRTHVHVRYSEGDGPGCDSTGFVDVSLLDGLVPTAGRSTCDAFLCGPLPFMAAAHEALSGIGIPPERIAYESFGPLESLELATSAS